MEILVNKRVIGILGGMGPQAGFDLASRITAFTKVDRDQDHVPIVVFSLPGDVPDRTRFLLGDESENPARSIIRQLEIMDSLGVGPVAIACNTAHAKPILDPVLDAIKKKGLRVHLYHLIDETVRFVKACFPNVESVGIVGTKATIELGLYTDSAEKLGLHTIIPERNILDNHVYPAIYDPVYGIKVASAPVSREAREHVERAVVHLAERGANAVILGCTELPLAVRESAESLPIPIVDPAEAIAKRLILAATSH